MFLFSTDAFSTEEDDINQKNFIPFGVRTITNFPVISKKIAINLALNIVNNLNNITISNNQNQLVREEFFLGSYGLLQKLKT